MEKQEIESLVKECLRYIRASKLPRPLPTDPLQYAEWRERAKALHDQEVDEDAEDAWFELDRLISVEPHIGWPILTQVALRCDDEDACAQIAAGPLSTFLHAHRHAFAAEIKEELSRNPGFRTAYNWLRE